MLSNLIMLLVINFLLFEFESLRAKQQMLEQLSLGPQRPIVLLFIIDLTRVKN